MIRRRLAATSLAALGLTAALLPTVAHADQGGPAAPAASKHGGGGASLSVSPAVYQPGQRLTFAGQVPGGKQPVHLQFNMNRPGDAWTDVQGSHATTDSSGHYSFGFPAPAMYGVSYRVASGHGVTPGQLMRARQPELTLTVTNPVTGLLTTVLGASKPFRVRVDAVASTGLTGPAPAIKGRPIAIQQRVNGDQWKTVASGKEQGDGTATFAMSAPSVLGGVTLRVVEGDWTKDGNRIGWFASFPLPLTVSNDDGSRSGHTATSAARTPVTALPASAPASRRQAGGSPNASQRYGWGEPLYDYAWEYGESLDSAAFRGTQRSAGWTDASDGTGRASHFNGGLKLDSGPGHRGDPDYGTTSATLGGHGATSGRWEFRFRWVLAGSHPALIQLVRPGSDGTSCAAPITVADVDAKNRRITFGTSVGSQDFAATKSISFGSDPHNVAVEVTSGHLTWFVDGRPVATTHDSAAIPGGPLTPRVSLQGGSHSDSHTAVIYDWIRGWATAKGHQVKSGTSLKPTSSKLGC